MAGGVVAPRRHGRKGATGSLRCRVMAAPSMPAASAAGLCNRFLEVKVMAEVESLPSQRHWQGDGS